MPGVRATDLDFTFTTTMHPQKVCKDAVKNLQSFCNMDFRSLNFVWARHLSLSPQASLLPHFKINFVARCTLSISLYFPYLFGSCSSRNASIIAHQKSIHSLSSSQTLPYFCGVLRSPSWESVLVLSCNKHCTEAVVLTGAAWASQGISGSIWKQFWLSQLQMVML